MSRTVNVEIVRRAPPVVNVPTNATRGERGPVGPAGPSGVYVSDTPPSDTTLIWVDTSS